MTSKPKPPPTYRVRIERHAIQPRWIVPASTVTIPAVNEAHAIEQAIGISQREAGCPPWRPCRRASLPYASAELVEVRAQPAAQLRAA
jgi:hypothetical protein